MDDETHYRLLKVIDANPQMSQRELADAMGVSVGKMNYCLKAAIACGWVKVKNFTRHENKRAYAYYLTRKGAEERARVTIRFLKRKMREYEELNAEIRQLKSEGLLDGVVLEGSDS